MRNVINISLPEELSRVVERAVKKGKFATKSEFFRNLLRLWEEGKLFSDLQESEKEFRAGKGRKLRSLADLR
ncbi:MAG: ribbon-helix-helix domain-containing protein [Patescibacteria group bacterium]